MEKNKDPLNDTVVDQFKKGDNALLKEIFADHPGQSGGKDEGGGKGKTKFKNFEPNRKYNTREDSNEKLNHFHSFLSSFDYSHFIGLRFHLNEFEHY